MRLRIERTRRGDYRLRIPPEERAVLRSLPAQLRELLGAEDASLRRLFPPAYQDDPAREQEYRSLVRDDLLAAKMRSLEVMEESVDADRLSEEQLLAWLGVLNDLRLVLGTRLEVTEDLDPQKLDDRDPRTPSFAIYFYLGWLEDQAVQALTAAIDQ